MLGLRCAPGLLGWTRLLDEWVVAVADHTEPLVDPGAIVSSFADAATRVRTFSGRVDHVDPTVADEQGTLRFDLQGIDYVVATEHRSFASADDMVAEVGAILDEAAARVAGERNSTGVAAVFVRPEVRSNEQMFIEATRGLDLAACAFSFADSGKNSGDPYANSTSKGVLLLVSARGF